MKSGKSIAVVLALTVLLVIGFSGCEMLGLSGGGSGNPSISVSDPNDLEDFEGSTPSSKSETLNVLGNSITSFQEAMGFTSGTSAKEMDGSSKSMTQSGSDTFNCTNGGAVSVDYKVTYPNETEETVLNNYESGSAPYQDVTLPFLIDYTANINNVQTAEGEIVNGKEDVYFDMKIRFDVDSSNLYPVHVSYEITYLYGFALSVSAADSSGTGGKFILELEAENSGSDTATSSTDTVFDSGMSVGSVSMSVKVYDNNNELVNSYDLTEAEMYDLTGIDPNGLFEMQ